MQDDQLTDEIPSTREQIFNYLIQHKEAHDGNSPTNRQIAEACHMSPSTVAYHLMRLERANRIRLSEDEYRNIEVVGGQWLRPRPRSRSGGPDTSGQEGEEARDTEPARPLDHREQEARSPRTTR